MGNNKNAKALENFNRESVDLQVFVHALGFSPDSVLEFMSNCSDPMLRDFCLRYVKVTIDEQALKETSPNLDWEKTREWFYKNVGLMDKGT